MLKESIYHCCLELWELLQSGILPRETNLLDEQTDGIMASSWCADDRETMLLILKQHLC